jgi:hypothetical protein
MLNEDNMSSSWAYYTGLIFQGIIKSITSPKIAIPGHPGAAKSRVRDTRTAGLPKRVWFFLQLHIQLG